MILSDFFAANFVAFLVFLSIMFFVLFGGMDLGIGILSPFMNKDDRKIAISSVHPFWDINETWLIMAAIFLLLGFTATYGIFISTFYIPVILLLGLLAIRGCSFELNHKVSGHDKIWDWLLFISSFGMVLIFGVFIGNLVNGLNMSDENQYLDGFFALFNPIALATGLLTVVGFALLGASWLLIKSKGSLNEFSKKAIQVIVKILFILPVPLLALIFFKENVWSFITSCCFKSFVFFTSIILGYFTLFAILKKVKKGSEKSVFALSYIFSILGGITLISTTYPYIVPYKLTIFELLRFKTSVAGFSNILIFAIILLLLTFVYFFKNYRVFKGKLDDAIEY